MTEKKAYKDKKDTAQRSAYSTESIICPEVVREPVPLTEQRISVRNLVEFLLRRGNIDNRRQGAPEHAMQEGNRIHRMLQRRMGTEYQAEVALRYTKIMEHYILVVEGRADGILDTQNSNTGVREVLIDEIKGTYRDLNKMKEPAPVHLAQAKCYAYFYGLKQDLDKLQVRMTYCNMETEEVRYFYFEYLFPELEEWFQELIREYQKWSDYEWNWRQLRKKTIEELTFPFEYREGQKELVAYVYQTICHKKKLFVEAPTGVGKTISTVYPAVKAVGADMAEKIFYLTAKTITRTVADNTFQLLRQQGLSFKTVILTAKDKICFMDKPECNPLACPYAKGHYDRINNAIYELLTQEENFTREKLECYARNHMVCPFEMCLDVSLFSDGVICDYNYLFDPHVYLKRFFGEGSHGSYIFLIDEAHNLLERGREMFSATLIKEQFLDLKRALSRIADRKNPTRTSSKPSEPFQQLELLSIMQEPITQPSLENRITKQEENQEQVKEQLGCIEQEKEKQKNTRQEKRSDQEKEKQESTEQEKRTKQEREQKESSKQEKEQLENLVQKNADLIETTKNRVEYRESSQGESESFDLQAEMEEHNLLEKRSILYRQGYASKIEKQLEKCNKEMLALKRKCETCQVVQNIDSLVQAVIRLQGTIDQYLDEQEEVSLPVREDILECYFELCHFLDIYERLDEHYVKYTQLEEDGRFILKLFCVNPAENLKECLARGRSSILFSATFLPIQYYKRLLGGEKEDYEVYAQSVFDPEKRELLIASDVTSKFTRRSEEEYLNIAKYIDEIVKNRHGNYLVFCPSYAFLRDIYERYVENFADEQRECILQQGFMDEKDREAFLERFAPRDYVESMQEVDKEGDYSLIGFCVLGGIFSEGIDLKKDRLIGVIIVGTGIPQVCWERELLKDYFNEEGENGFDYSYRYPGMNKVLQAAGRVIRTMEDIGVIALLDERFLQYTYQRLFPREWSSFQIVTVNTVAKRVERFWDSWL